MSHRKVGDWTTSYRHAETEHESLVSNMPVDSTEMLHTKAVKLAHAAP